MSSQTRLGPSGKLLFKFPRQPAPDSLRSSVAFFPIEVCSRRAMLPILLDGSESEKGRCACRYRPPFRVLFSLPVIHLFPPVADSRHPGREADVQTLHRPKSAVFSFAAFDAHRVATVVHREDVQCGATCDRSGHHPELFVGRTLGRTCCTPHRADSSPFTE